MSSTLLSNSGKPLLNNYLQKLAIIFGPYAGLLVMMILGLLLLSLSRIGLVLWQWERVAASGIGVEILIQGVRVDIIQLSLLCLPPLLLAPILATARWWSVWCKLTYGWVIAAIALLFLLEAATPGFLGEYGIRPNRMFIEYLNYPEDVMEMLWGGFRLHVIACLLLTSLVVWGMRHLMRPCLSQPRHWPTWKVWLTWPLIFLVLAFAIRSTTGHRPANPAMFALTADTMVNSLILNSTWSVSHAIYNLKHEKRSSEVYGKMPSDEIYKIVRETRNADWQASDALPTLNQLTPSRKRARPLNLVIVLEESLGATFVESLGGIGVTPELEKLKQHGWWFEHLYATGTRSVRGIEAVTTGFLPTPAQSVVKLSLAQRHFFTIAALLKQQGYHTEFIYGGEAHFDNMRDFFTGNGFETIIEEKDYRNPIFVGSWGVSDEDLFNMAHEQISRHHASGTPFFSLIFTSSNHSPFEFPDGKIELHDEEKATENNAVKYADYALGQFFQRARNSSYWQDTLFLVVADHDIRVRGDDLVPVERFHIPGLILGADIEPKRIKTVASQIDLPVTALSLMGISARHPMLGRDLSAEPENTAGRAMMQFEQHYGWMEGTSVVVLRPEKTPVHTVYDRARKELIAGEPPADAEEMQRRALAHALLPSLLYRERKYHLPDNPPKKYRRASR